MEEMPGYLESSVPSRFEGLSLCDYLATRFTYFSSGEWSSRISEGSVLLNGRRAGEADPVHQGDRVGFSSGSGEDPLLPDSYRLLQEHRDYLIVDKPPHLPVHPAGRYRRGTLWNLVTRDFGQAHLMNRLDRETSGIVAFSRNPAGTRLFQKSMLIKRYLVLVHGDFEGSLSADGWISRDESGPVRKRMRFSYSFPDNSAAKSASTAFARLAGNGEFTLLSATLGTGRTHQIRATLSSLGFPVVGDKLYGVDPSMYIRLGEGLLTPEDETLLMLPHQALHAAFLSLEAGPATRDWAAALPPDYAALVKRLFSLDLSSDDSVRQLCSR